MLAKCLNPLCDAPFRYLRQGRMFNLEIPVAAGHPHRREHFWLCDQCAASLTVVLNNEHVTVQPLYPEIALPKV
jgi:hypothetical protein